MGPAPASGEGHLSMGSPDFRAMAEATGLGLWAADATGQIQFMNGPAARMLGWSRPETLVGRHVSAILFPEDLNAWARRADSELPAAELVEQRFRRKDGTEAWLLVSIAHRAASSTRQGSIGFCVDVTEAHRARVSGDQAQAALHQLSSAISEFFWLEDPTTGNLVHVSPHPERVWGLSAADLRARPDAWMDLVHPEDRDRVETAWKGRASSGEWAIEFRIARPGGEVRWIRGSTFPILDPAGALVRLARTWEDVTEKIRVADRLRLQATALECAANAIVVTDAQGRVEWANRAFTALTGYPPEEVLGRGIQILRSGVHDQGFYRRLWETITAGRVWHGTVVNRRADGSFYEEEMTISPVADPDGTIRHFVAVKQDVTESKRAAEALRETQGLLSQATDAIVLEALDGTVRTWTQGAERVFGWSTAEAIGQRFTSLVGLDRPEQLAEIREQVASLGSWAGDLRVRSHAGNVLEVASRWTRLDDLTGAPRGILVVAHDVTAERRLRSIAERTERLDLLGQVAGAVAHDLNNVLTAIFSALPVLHAYHLDAEGREVIDTIDRAAVLAQGLVRQIVDFVRGSSGTRRRVRGAELLLPAVKMVGPTMRGGICLRTAWTPDLWEVDADCTQIQQVLMNLFVNAREAMPQGGTLLVTASNVEADEALVAATPGLRLGRYLEIRVADTGGGMPPEIRQRVFEPFVTTKERGTGLGLATVYRVVAAHGGAVSFSSELGAGTEFRIYLPAADGAAPL
ncbi:MAG TPA: PAS domain S-box protein [Anaeromyxobacteraceae bacterium]|nr:PAS domain S-box protein [Anaeromyxobacteraceae bacterium]